MGSQRVRHNWSDLAMHSSPPGSSVHGISQARILRWVAISFPKGSSWPRDQTASPILAGGFFTTEPPGKPCLLDTHSLYIHDILCVTGITVISRQEIHLCRGNKHGYLAFQSSDCTQTLKFWDSQGFKQNLWWVHNHPGWNSPRENTLSNWEWLLPLQS